MYWKINSVKNGWFKSNIKIKIFSECIKIEKSVYYTSIHLRMQIIFMKCITLPLLLQNHKHKILQNLNG